MFLAYMLIGGARLYQMHRTQPGTLAAIERDLERALAASAHAAAETEETHHIHLPGASHTPHVSPTPAGAPLMTTMTSQRE
jgi:cytochrome bd-type quinol oxidase subunit 1